MTLRLLCRRWEREATDRVFRFTLGGSSVCVLLTTLDIALSTCLHDDGVSALLGCYYAFLLGFHATMLRRCAKEVCL
jgi:hypothetical protein